MSQIITETRPLPAAAGEEDHAAYRRAQTRVRALRGYYIHVGVYIIVNVFLFAVNMVTDRSSLWFYWPLLGWGAALAIHTFTVFTDSFLGSRWEERKIREYMNKEQ